MSRRRFSAEYKERTQGLNRRAGEMEGMDVDAREFRDAVLVADFLAGEITAAVGKLRKNTAPECTGRT